MEADKNVIQANYTNLYLNRLAHYAGFSSICCGILSAMLLMKFKRGFFLGLGLGAGYCHNDLLNMMKSIQK